MSSIFCAADYYHRLRRAFLGRPFSAMVNRLSHGIHAHISVVMANEEKKCSKSAFGFEMCCTLIKQLSKQAILEVKCEAGNVLEQA